MKPVPDYRGKPWRRTRKRSSITTTIGLLAVLLPALGVAAPIPTPQQLHIDSTAANNSPIKHWPRPPDSALDTFNFRTGTIYGAGIGFSLGSLPPFDLWNGNLPQQFSDLGLSDTAFQIQGLDTGQLAYVVRQSPDIYSMTFPVTVYIGRLTPNHRLTAALSFAWLSKEYDARVSLVNDSARYFDLRQTFGYYSLTAALTWGTRIPERYFSVDGIDRTDAMIGILASPYIALQRSSTIGAPPTGDIRLTELYDSIVPQMSSFSATGIAYGWRMGLATIRHHSKKSGIEAELTYSGLWNTQFRTSSGASLLQGNLGDKSASAGAAFSYYTSRIEISISLFRKVFYEQPQRKGTP
ncbi:MAG: hypothetical protein ABSE00_10200 [Chitinispirillaceae bacterium]